MSPLDLMVEEKYHCPQCKKTEFIDYGE
ncbi:hypothetical protein LCGC14_2399450, partial [marine sediment metagenome]